MRALPYILAAGCLLGSAACGSSGDAEASASASANAAAARNTTARPVLPPIPPRSVANPNPLNLPARKLELADGARIFVVPEAMLREARAGSTMTLVGATVAGRDGDNIVVDGKDGPDYSIHAAYVIPVLAAKRIRPNQPVIAEWAQGLRHGVAKRYAKDKVVVRFTDTQDKGERQIEPARVMGQTEGFWPGNYAAQRLDGELEHVLLVSPIGAEPKTAAEWLVLGYGGAARVVPTTELVNIPIVYDPKVNTQVLAEHLGKMRPGVVKAIDRPGVLSVRFERAGRAIETGWGKVMPVNAPRPAKP